MRLTNNNNLIRVDVNYVKRSEICIVFDVDITAALNKYFKDNSISQRSSQMNGCLSNFIFGIYTPVGTSSQ